MLKKKKRRILSFLLVCILTLSLPFAVSAVSMQSFSTMSTRQNMFAAYAQDVEDFVCTETTNKVLHPGQLPKTAVMYVDGYLYHSNTDSSRYVIRSGLCFDNGSYYERVNALSQETLSGGHIYRSLARTSLNANTDYYLFIKNIAGSGSVNGGYIELYYYY